MARAWSTLTPAPMSPFAAVCLYAKEPAILFKEPLLPDEKNKNRLNERPFEERCVRQAPESSQDLVANVNAFVTSALAGGSAFTWVHLSTTVELVRMALFFTRRFGLAVQRSIRHALSEKFSSSVIALSCDTVAHVWQLHMSDMSFTESQK